MGNHPFRVCPACGSNLDPGERCDCALEREPDPTTERATAENARAMPPERAYYGGVDLARGRDFTAISGRILGGQ